MTDARELLDAHHKLDHESRDRGGRVFISDWYCEHPLVDAILPANSDSTRAPRDFLPYYFQNDQHHLHAQIAEFHASKGEGRLEADDIFVMAGLSPLITAQMLLLKRRGVKRLFYMRPLYYTYYFLAETLELELIPLNSGPLLGVDAAIDLPQDRNQYLLLCDPVWYLGRNISSSVIDAIREWNVSRATVRSQFNRLALGGARLSAYGFSYTYPNSQVGTDCGDPRSLSFDVELESQPPTNVHVIIGRNGVGKSRLLNRIANVLIRPTDEADEGAIDFIDRETGTGARRASAETWETESQFANLVSVAFSAFDEFEPIRSSQDRSRGKRTDLPSGCPARTVATSAAGAGERPDLQGGPR